MHRAAVDAHCETRMANEPDELQDGGVIEQVDAILRRRQCAPGAADEDDAVRREGVAEFFDNKIAERLSLPAGEGMQEDKGSVLIEAIDAVAAWQGEAQWPPHRHAEGFDEREVALDGVGLAIDLGGVLVKEMGAFARVAHPVKISRMTHPANERTTEKTLEIEGDIRLEAADLAEPGKEMLRHAEAAEVAAREDVDVIDALVAAQKGGPFRIDHPGDVSFGVSFAEKGDSGQSMNDIA